jgi:hypothetical protein
VSDERIAKLETLVTERFDRLDEKLESLPALDARVLKLEISAANARAWLAGAVAMFGALLWVASKLL